MNINRALAEPDALSVARNRAAVVEELRRLLPGIEDLPTALPFGLAAINSHLPQGGLACGGLHEVVPEAGATAAAFGFLAAILARRLPLWGGVRGGGGRLCTSIDALTSPRDPPPSLPHKDGSADARLRDAGLWAARTWLALRSWPQRFRS